MGVFGEAGSSIRTNMRQREELAFLPSWDDYPVTMWSGGEERFGVEVRLRPFTSGTWKKTETGGGGYQGLGLLPPNKTLCYEIVDLERILFHPNS